MNHDQLPTPAGPDNDSRRSFMKQTGGLLGLAITSPLAEHLAEPGPAPAARPNLTLHVNGRAHTLRVAPRETLLDVLRERLDLTGTKKGCDHGQCGACTVHVDGQRVNACLLLAVRQQGRQVVTIEGLAADLHQLHPLQAAFIEHDGFQCGFCTPGQIMSGVACVREGHADSREEIREWMSGNICRCGAYVGIVAAVEAVQKTGKPL